MPDNNHNIFVSHYHSDSKYIEDLKNMLKKRNEQVRDSSIYESKSKNKANNEDYIRSLIRPQIEWAGKVIVLIGQSTSQSDWVNWEIEHAARKGKQIIGVYLEQNKDFEIPRALKEYGDALVDWNAKDIIAALHGESLWNDRGTGANSIERSNC